MRLLGAAIVSLFFGAVAAAQPVTGSGAEIAWTSPPEQGAVLDVAAKTEQTVSMGRPRRLPARGWLVTHIRAGDVAWVHLDGDPEGKSVRFAFLSGGAEAAAAIEAVPERRGPGDFLFQAPVGPETRLGLSVRAGQPAPRAQIWVGSVQSPGFRWELWEEQLKKWAARPAGLPPGAPDLVGETLINRLAMVADAAQLAQAESPAPAREAIAALLVGEALLENQPAREPLFPYFRRYELTGALAAGRPVNKVEEQRMFAMKDKETLRFSVDGPGFLRIEARARFADGAPRRAVPLQLLLGANGRTLAVAAEEVLSKDPKDLKQPGPELISSRRRIVQIAAPGRHTYELQVRGGPAWLGVIMHTRTTHAEDLASHGEDIPRLLQRARAGSGLLAQLLCGEASFLALDDAAARECFERLAQGAHSPRLRAFARLRLAALALSGQEGERTTRDALAQLDGLADDAAVRLRNYLVAQHLTQVLAGLEPATAAPAEAVALLLRTPGALPYMMAAAGPLLRYIPGPRSLALPLLAAAQSQTPLNVALRHYLGREWFTGTRWSSLPAVETGGAMPIELLVPPLEPISCRDARDEGVRAYAPLGEGAVAWQVPASLAPSQHLRRFNLIALRRGAPRLGWADLTLDGERTRMPLLLSSEPIALALGAGPHTLSATIAEEKAASLLGPCELQREPVESAILVEHHFSILTGHDSKVRVITAGPGTPGFLGLELRPNPALRGGRLIVRSDQGVLGRIEVDGHGIDPLAAGRALGPALTVALPLPAKAQVVEIVREDDGAPLLLRALLRRSLARLGQVEPRLPAAERTPQQLELLRKATRAVRHAEDDSAKACARVDRAELLLGLNAVTFARNDLEQGLAALKDGSSLRRALSLVAAATELPLLAPQPGARSAVILAPGAGLTADAADSACVTGALSQLATSPESGRMAAGRCSGVIGAYAAGLLEEQGGSSLRAAQHYENAYRQALAAGLSRPALARQAALQYAENGPAPGSKHGLALAALAAQEHDPDGERALALVRGLGHSQAVRSVDVGEAVRVAENNVPPLSLRAALADLPWETGTYLEAHAGRSTETDFLIKQPVRVRVEVLCDDQGEPPGAPSALAAPPCSLQLGMDGTALAAPAVRLLPAGQRVRAAEVDLARGVHRIQVALDRRHGEALAFIHLSANRSFAGAAASPDADGWFGLPITAPPVQRFVGTPGEPVQLRVLGPSVLRLDALIAGGAAERSLNVELTREDKRKEQFAYPVCTKPAEQQAPAAQPEYNCRSMVMVPLVHPGTYQVRVVPKGTPLIALALNIYDDERPVAASDSQNAAQEPGLGDKPAPRSGASFQGLTRPLSNAIRALGTLQIQQLGVFGSAGNADPRIGDTFAETSITYRRKLDDLPIWFRAGTYVRLRSGPTTFGLEGLAFGRIPVLNLRVYAQLQGFTQQVDGNQEFALGFHSYLERSIELTPHLFLLPRFAVTASYQSLANRSLPASRNTQDGDLGNASPTPTPIDLLVFNQFDAAHKQSIYGQLLLWWVPFINMITYAEMRLSSNQTVQQLDGVRGRIGVDVAFYTTELSASYRIDHFLVDDARTSSLLYHTFSAEVQQTLWLNRNHRLGFTLRGNVEAVTQATTFVLGAFWEGSRGRGLDDYSTQEINLPQQLGRGRGFQRPEETLR